MNPYIRTPWTPSTAAFFYAKDILGQKADTFVPWPETLPWSEIWPEPHAEVTWQSWQVGGATHIKGPAEAWAELAIYWGSDRHFIHALNVNAKKFLIVENNVFRTVSEIITSDIESGNPTWSLDWDTSWGAGKLLLTSLFDELHVSTSPRSIPIPLTQQGQNWARQIIATLNSAYEEWDPKPWIDSSPRFKTYEYETPIIQALISHYESDAYELEVCDSNGKCREKLIINFGIWPGYFAPLHKDNLPLLIIEGGEGGGPEDWINWTNQTLYYSAAEVIAGAYEIFVDEEYINPENIRYHTKMLDMKIQDTLDRIK